MHGPDSAAPDGRETASAADRCGDGPDDAGGDRSVLLVGTFAGGGIHQYVDNQRAHLAEEMDVSTYDMYAPPEAGEDRGGLRWGVRTALAILFAALRFPFRRRPDVVHVHASFRYSFYRAVPYVLVAALLWRRPVVFHVHGSSFDEFVATDSWPVGAVQSLVYRRCDRIVVLSPYWRDVLAMRADERKLVVLPNAVDADAYDPEYGADPPRVVFVSTLIERKGVAELIEAVDALAAADVDVRVDLAGDGPYRDQVEALADRHESVRYHGYVSEARKRELLDRGSVYVLPTHAECLPIAMLEGMAGGNAVVATPVGGIPDVVDEDGGVLVPPGDPEALADALAGLLSDPERIERAGRHNRALVRESYTWERAIRRLRRLYADLAADGIMEPDDGGSSVTDVDRTAAGFTFPGADGRTQNGDDRTQDGDRRTSDGDGRTPDGSGGSTSGRGLSTNRANGAERSADDDAGAPGPDDGGGARGRHPAADEG